MLTTPSPATAHPMKPSHPEFEQLYRRTRDSVYRLALCYVHDQDHALQLCHDVYLRFLQQAVRVPVNAPAFLRVMTRNACLDFLRRRTTERAVLSQLRPRNTSVAQHNAADVSALAEAVRQLPDSLREIVMMHCWADLTFREIGETLDITTNAAIGRYQQALQLLRSRYHE